MSNVNELLRQIELLNDKLEDQPTCPFTPEEIAQGREAIEFIKKVRILGWWGQKILWILAGLAALAINFERIRAVLTGGSP